MLNKKGFTLVELLVVITIIAILMIIAAVKVPQMLTRASEAKTKDHLFNLRVAINNYYSTNAGIYPLNFDNQADIIGGQQVPAFVPSYMSKIPKAKLKANLEDGSPSNSNSVTVIDTGKNFMTTAIIATQPRVGGWIYSSTTGEIRINCLVKDSREKIYYSCYGHEANE